MLGYGLVFGYFGLPALGPVRWRGWPVRSSGTLLALTLALVIVTDRQFHRFHLFGRFWRPDWPRYRRPWLPGFPIGLAMGFEGGVFSAAAYLMGLINAELVAVHAVALQIAALCVHGSWGPRFTRLPFGSAFFSVVAIWLVSFVPGGQPGLVAFGFMALMALLDLVSSRASHDLVPRRYAGKCAGDLAGLVAARHRRNLPGPSTVRRWSGRECSVVLDDTRVPMIFTFLDWRASGLLDIGISLRFCRFRD